MDNAIAGIDHIIVGVRDLEHARMVWTRLGFTLSPRGRHIGQGTANYCIMFASDYIELLGIVDPNDFVQRLDNFLAQREGLMAAAFAPAMPPEELRAALLRRQLHPSEPRALGRQLELPPQPILEINAHALSPVRLRTIARPRLTRLRTVTSEMCSERAMSA